MTINLAKVLPWLGVLLGLGIWALAQSSEGATDYDDSGYQSSSYSYNDTTNADAYLDQVAVELAQPGLYVDPEVASYKLSSGRIAELDALAADTPGPVRIAVIPAAAVREGGPDDQDTYSYYTPDLAYAEDELVAQLYDRVGVDGTYAIIVDASSSEDGRSFTAYQYAEDPPFYDVEGALDDAVDCCAPDYDRMLATFIANAGQEPTNPWPIIGWITAGIAVLGGGGWGLSRWVTRRRQRREDEQVADALRPSLNDEVVELSRTVAALPAAPAAVPSGAPASAGTADVATRTRTVLDLVEAARQSLDVEDGSRRMDTPSEVEDVVRRLANARYELLAIDALRKGEPVPERTAPCFYDPRHGPSTAQRKFTPEFGLEREVPVCAACAAKVDAGEKPEMRTITVDGREKPYWQWDRYSRPYVNGYWQRHTFADQGFQRTRYGAPKPVAKSAGSGFSFVWESDSGGGGGSSWSSGGSSRRSFSGSSGRRSSFGGGRSSRSSSRSGGSRKF